MSRSARRIERVRAANQRRMAARSCKPLRVKLFALIGLEAPAFLVKGDLAVVGDTFEKAVEGLCQAGLELLGCLPEFRRKAGAFPEVLPYLLPFCGRQEEGLKAAEVLGAFDGERTWQIKYGNRDSSSPFEIGDTSSCLRSGCRASWPQPSRRRRLALGEMTS